jgi:hypothetical protein
MRGAVTLTIILSTSSVLAQYGPPARDLRDAVRMLQEVQRLIDPAIAAVRDDTAVLNALAKAEKQLKDAQSMSSFDEAGKVIDDFMKHRDAVDPPLSKDLKRTIDDARKILTETRPMMAVGVARERLHHDIVHPLQRQVLRNAGELQQLFLTAQYMSQRFITGMPDALGTATYASTDPK